MELNRCNDCANFEVTGVDVTTCSAEFHEQTVGKCNAPLPMWLVPGVAPHGLRGRVSTDTAGNCPCWTTRIVVSKRRVQQRPIEVVV